MTRIMEKISHTIEQLVQVLVAVTLVFIFFTGGETKAEEAKVVALYTYHTHSPFITGEKTGLTYDLAEFLTQHSKGQYIFDVVPASRPRINRVINSNHFGVVPWVNPNWFKDPERKRYLWSRQILMQDGNAVVSHQRKPIIYNRPKELSGLTIGGLKGHRYEGIDDVIAANDSIRRVDADIHAENIAKLRRGDIDLMLMPQSAALFSIAREGLSKELFISPKPHSQYDRLFLIIGGHSEFSKYLDMTLANYRDEWLGIVSRYE